MRNFLSIVSLANVGHEVYEHGADIKCVNPTQFTGGVILGEGVVVVVVAFTHSSEGHEKVLAWVNMLVVWLVSPQVGSTVDTPGGVQE